MYGTGVLGPLSRSKQADYRVPIFEKIGVWACLSTAVESARILHTGQNVAHSPSRVRALYKTHPRVLKTDNYFFELCMKDDLLERFCV